MSTELSLDDTKDSSENNLPSTSGTGSSGAGSSGSGIGGSGSSSNGGNGSRSNSANPGLHSAYVPSSTAAAATAANPFNSYTSTDFNTGASSHHYQSGNHHHNHHSHHHQFKLESEPYVPTNTSQLSAFNNSTNTVVSNQAPTYANLIDCSTPIPPNQYSPYHAANSLSSSHHQAAAAAAMAPSYHNLTSHLAAYSSTSNYMQSFPHYFGQATPSAYPGQYDMFGNGLMGTAGATGPSATDSDHLMAALANTFQQHHQHHHPNIKTEYGAMNTSTGSTSSNKRSHNDNSDTKDHLHNSNSHTLTLLGGPNGSSQIIAGGGQASTNNNFSNHNLDTNSETGK